jgi:hypothetical protein
MLNNMRTQAVAETLISISGKVPKTFGFPKADETERVAVVKELRNLEEMLRGGEVTGSEPHVAFLLGYTLEMRKRFSDYDAEHIDCGMLYEDFLTQFGKEPQDLSDLTTLKRVGAVLAFRHQHFYASPCASLHALRDDPESFDQVVENGRRTKHY